MVSPMILSALLSVAGAIAASAGPFDFTHFETELMPAWIASMKSGNGGIGEYSWLPSRLRKAGEGTSIYGSTDMVYAFYATGLLDTLSVAEKSMWAQTINAFQNRSTGW